MAAEVEPPVLSEAQASIVTDNAGNVLYENNADDLYAPASITKIMSAMVALDAGIPMDTVVTIPELDLPENAQAAGYEAGSTATFEQLMEVMLVYSANDAAQVVAIEVAGSETAFADLMNAKAQELGMANTSFKNASGLDEDGHYSCARDLAIMGRYALTHYPFIAQMVDTPSVTVDVNGTPLTFETTDELLGYYPGMRGIKTGRGDTGTTFLGACRRANTMVYTCVLGCSSDWGRFEDTMDLLNWAYVAYEKSAYATAGQTVAYAPFAWRFGFVLPVASSSTVYGLAWPEGSGVDWTRIGMRSGSLTTPGSVTAVQAWVQDGRGVAHAAYEAAAVPIPGTSGNPVFALPLTGSF
jgi:D-alanyl-D-alanine carboxypeptidase (penicillin-binding protein 5/6)